MNIQEAKFKDVYVIQESYHKDDRGMTYTIYNEDIGNLCPPFILDKVIVGKKNAMRGFHGDDYTWKLITCLDGAFELALLDLREGETFKQTLLYKLSRDERQSILVPPGVFNAHYGLKKYVFHYKWTHKYDLSKQKSIKCKIWKNCIVSDRDKKSPTLEEYLSEAYRIR